MTRLTVVGAGTMGHGIAQVGAIAGCDTVVTDARAEALDAALARVRANLEGAVQRGKLTADEAEAALGRITLVPDVETAARDADFVVEAIIEDLEAKRQLFSTLDDLVASDAVLATNTSSLSVTQIAGATKRPGRVLGMHFFNPVHIMKLVELVVHRGTDEATLGRAKHMVVQMGKHPVVVQDSPGFASSRLGVVLGLEAMRMVEAGVATAEDIDKAMELGYGHPMGPLKVSDLVGLDVRLAIADYLHRELKGAHYAAPEVLRRKVQAGELGKKTGKGFYEWPTKKPS
ncbi:MAG: 3-hydroxybutyryl-CoA dehydrogenase [Gemmatimonadales bacterium]|nr:3-hydroxybutyryl-CoA dehydrogenase [Gemmatimonadales bacterium]NIN12422.1 3-hydroxybutyryl-CoA dehydrogenase [Gemmatimonadales bacterium]NIN50798.1 3-hydroxybutyryl-CoA dehydrogenase [Gemmatimonadales bacterium]NIP08262.1 3-hydroxybutyryl-CoA dehydrogenase [Gemmatimonadales bacterium]NIR00786.1 3-hydroxybutyryl-CoA dehydrogenase [Gemmatimonadales bacterium]